MKRDRDFRCSSLPTRLISLVLPHSPTSLLSSLSHVTMTRLTRYPEKLLENSFNYYHTQKAKQKATTTKVSKNLFKSKQKTNLNIAKCARLYNSDYLFDRSKESLTYIDKQGKK